MSTTNSPNMKLPVPTIGSEPGPNYASDINAALALIDQHNHTPGSGVQINPSGLNINAALTFNNNSATGLAASVFNAQTAITTLLAVYVKGVDLYYRDGNNNEIAITTGGNVNAGAGSITGLSGTAGVAYSSSVFTFSASTNTPANIQIGSLLLGNNTALSKYLTLAPPNAMAANYAITLPSIPAAQSFLTIDNSGNISPGLAFSAGITTSNIASATILGSNIAAATITGSNIASATVTGSNVASATITGSNIAALTVGPGNLTALNSATISIASSSVATGATVMSQTLTTSGRPVMAILRGFNTTSVIAAPSAAGDLRVAIRIDGAQIAGQDFTVLSGPANNYPMTGPVIAITTPSAGTHTYDVALTAFVVTGNISITNYSFTVFEL